MTDLWKRQCRVRRAANDSGIRKASAIDLIVIHSAESTSASGVASYFSSASTQASTHLAVDDTECWRMLSDLTIPWGAAGANHDGLHVEICGYARWNEDEWMQHRPMLALTAAKCGKWAWQYRVPVRWLTVDELRAGKRGFTTHVDVNAAFRKGTHWDPGPGFPRDWFIGKCRYWRRQVYLDRRR